jgi:hypothetical protein
MTPIFLGGAPRSGLTLLRAMLDAHSAIACGPDLPLVAGLARQAAEVERVIGGNLAANYDLPGETVRGRYRKLIEDLLEPLPARSGKARAAEKTGANLMFFEALHALFPDAPLIHVVRDGRDVAASLLGRRWTGPNGRPTPASLDARSGAQLWAAMVRTGRAAGERCGGRYFEIHYEDIVRAPEEALRHLCRFIGEDWDPAMLAFHHRPLRLVGSEGESARALGSPLSRRFMGRWRRDLVPDMAGAVDALLAPVLAEFGYRGAASRSA